MTDSSIITLLLAGEFLNLIDLSFTGVPDGFYTIENDTLFILSHLLALAF